MLLTRGYRNVPIAARAAVLALGNFDGVHRGHRAILARAQDVAGRLGVPAGALTFEPHPRRLFRPDDPPFRLTPLRAKVRHMAELDLDLLAVLRFDRRLAGLDADSFVADVLVRGYGVRHVVVGHDFVFGRDRGGDVELLRRLGERHGYGVTQLDVQRAPDGTPFSSTAIRARLREGDVRGAAELLGRPWEVGGRVRYGDQRGRTIGFPTANLTLGQHLRPAYGVYAVMAGIDLGAATVWHPGVANIGRRPTVDGLKELLEVHLFDRDDDLYGRHLRVRLIDYLRPERKFPDFAALRTQIEADAREARQRLAAPGLSDGAPA